MDNFQSLNHPASGDIVQAKTRNSGIDLLRIIAMLCIVLFHANQTMGGLVETAFPSSWWIIHEGIGILGNIDNALFVICSCLFLADKERTRSEKAINILVDSMLVSILVLSIYLISGYQQLGLKEIAKNILPDLFDKVWFVPCYVLFYLLSPIVICGLKHLGKKAHFTIAFFGLFIYGMLSVVSLAPLYTNLMGFFLILTIVCFIKWHKPDFIAKTKTNLMLFIIGLVLMIGLSILAAYLRTKSDLFGYLVINSRISPFMLIPLLSLSFLFYNMKWSNRFVSYLGGCTLFVYIIHENYLLRTYLRVDFYKYLIANFGEGNVVLYVLLCGLIMFIGGFVLSAIYKESLGRLTKWLSHQINRFFVFIGNKAYEKAFDASKEEDADN